MNSELRKLFDEKDIVIKGITLRNNVIIIDNGNEKFVIKKRDNNLEKLYNYLLSRGFVYFPKIIYKTDNYQYINDVDINYEEKALDIIRVVSLLHSKTTFYKDIDDDSYKKMYEDILSRIDYLEHYYDDIASWIEKEEYMSPSHYFFIRNISGIFYALRYCRVNIKKWYSIIESKKRVRLVNIHNNLSLDHCIVSDKPYLISWKYSKKDIPIYDLIKLYRSYYNELDFCDLIKCYEDKYPLLIEEKILFLVLISIPSKLEFVNREYDMCKMVKEFYEYLNNSNILVLDYDKSINK